jgi:large subunit ribosomal protein L4e
MKLKILNTKNSENGTINFPLTEEVRPDLIKRACEALASKKRQPYGATPRAGLKHSTNVSRRRRKYRGSYGKGISRVPRKILSRSGLQFHWKGAEAPGTVGGRRAHPPKAEKIWARKINQKENRKAINSAISAALNKEVVVTRGHKIPKLYPFALDDDFEKITKTQELRGALETIGFTEDLVRGMNGGKTVLIVTESQELAKAARNIPGVDAASFRQLNAELLAPGTHPGRATLFTKSSVEKIGELQ